MKASVCKKFAPVSELVWEEVADPVADQEKLSLM